MVIIRNVLFFIVCFPATYLGAQNQQELLTDELQNHFESSSLPGFSVAIVNESGTVYSRGFGFSNIDEQKSFKPSTVHNLGSVSKTMVGLVLVKAIEAGFLKMGDPINQYLSFKIFNPYYPADQILVKHLATHSSTLTDTKHYRNSYVYRETGQGKDGLHQGYAEFIKSHEKIEQTEFIERLFNKNGSWYKKKNFLKVVPGEKKEYANVNAVIVAMVIEGATGKSFDEYSADVVFQPLGMKSTSWHPQALILGNFATGYFPSGAVVPTYSLITYPDGGLFSSTSDLSIYLQELILAFNGTSTYLNSDFAKLLLPGDSDDYRAFIGMGTKSRNIGHQGSDPGTQTDLQFNADSKIGRVIICNVNAEDNEELWVQYRGIHKILDKYESQLQ